MQSSSFQTVFPKKKPAFDVIAPRKVIFQQPMRRESFFQEAEKTNLSYKGLDGIRKDRHSLLIELQERSFKDSFHLVFRRGQIYFRRAKRLLARLIPDMAPKRMVYASIVSGIAFGMVSMAFIGSVFGPGVFADEPIEKIAGVSTNVSENENTEESAVAYDPSQDIFFEYFNEATGEQYEAKVREMVKGYPIEAMLPYILEQDRMTAAFLIGIGKKESNWGKRIPVLDGQDCFNYWGYRGIRRMMGTGGHTCFNSRKDAVDTVAARIEKLTQSEQLNTPEKLIVWKCGFSCEGHSRESVKKWISDVDMYYGQLKDE